MNIVTNYIRSKIEVSIIIPVYNVAPYISDCIQSLINQVFRLSYELVIINDGSTDDSYKKIINALTRKIDYCLIDNSNRGVSYSRNLGIKYSRGEYICFVDSDDICDKYYLQELYNSLKLTDADIALCNNLTFYGNIKPVYKKNNKKKIECINSYDLMGQILYHKKQYAIWSLLCKKEMYLNHNISFAEGYSYSEDLVVVWELIAVSKKVAIVDDRLYFYRIRKNSAMNTFDVQKRYDGFVLFQKLESFIKINRPEFYSKFEKHALAYWVWSTIRQAVRFSNNYDEFETNINIFKGKYYLKKLYDYPNVLVRISAHIFCKSEFLYYSIIKLYNYAHNIITKFNLK